MSGLGAPAGDGGHPLDDLPSLVAGTLELGEVRSITAHLRACDACRRELVEVVGATAALELLRTSDAAPLGLEDLTADEDADLPPLVLGRLMSVAPRPSSPDDAEEPDDAAPRPRPARPSRRRALLAGAAAAAVAAILVATVAVTRSSGPSTVAVALQPVGSSTGRGTVRMTTSGADRTMTVDTRLSPASNGSFYEVWLLDQATGRMLSVGVLPDDGKARFSLPADLLAAYDSVDVSLEPDDGVPAHSADSVLRAKYGSTS